MFLKHNSKNSRRIFDLQLLGPVFWFVDFHSFFAWYSRQGSRGPHHWPPRKPSQSQASEKWQTIRTQWHEKKKHTWKFHMYQNDQYSNYIECKWILNHLIQFDWVSAHNSCCMTSRGDLERHPAIGLAAAKCRTGDWKSECQCVGTPLNNQKTRTQVE